MGSFLSIQSKDKRRRSNRLSKPPQNKTITNSVDLRSPVQPVEHNLLSPTSPVTWQNPWSGTSIPVSPISPISPTEIESTGECSQSFRCGSLQSEAPWALVTGPCALGAQQTVQNTAELWLTSPTSPTSSSSRQGSLYRRASFQPSWPVTFQPTTLQSNPQSPLIGQPKRSYSVHSPPHRSRSIIQGSTLEETAFSNISSKSDGQGFPLIRRRSLLTRPGVATRRSTNEASHQRYFESSQNGFSPISYQNIISVTPQLSFAEHEETVFNCSTSPPPPRPPTPSEFEYTHLGALKLGSLRVVNGSASPCSSDRTRLNYGGSPAPEAIQDSLHPVELLDLTESRSPAHQAPVSMVTSDGSIGNRDGLNGVSDSSPTGSETPSNNIFSSQNIQPRGRLTNAALDMPLPALGSMKRDEFPGRAFSFDKSPTTATSRKMSFREGEDEGISIWDEERIFPSPPEKAPERYLGYRRLSHSHRKVDSGYSSAASVRSLQDSRHRTSMDSQTSSYRSPVFRRFTLGGGSGDLDFDGNVSTKFGNQLPINRHLSLRGTKVSPRPDLSSWSTNMSTMCHESRQLQASGRLRSSSLTVAETSNRILSLPLYCAQLRNIESTVSEFQRPLMPEAGDNETKNVNGSRFASYIRGDFPDLFPGHGSPPLAPIECDHGEYRYMEAASSPAQDTALAKSCSSTGNYHCRNSLKAHRPMLGNKSPEKYPIDIVSRKDSSHSAIKAEMPMSNNGTLFLHTRSNAIDIPSLEKLRGRTRSRSIEYRYHRASNQQLRKAYA